MYAYCIECIYLTLCIGTLLILTLLSTMFETIEKGKNGFLNQLLIFPKMCEESCLKKSRESMSRSAQFQGQWKNLNPGHPYLPYIF